MLCLLSILATDLSVLQEGGGGGVSAQKVSESYFMATQI